MEVDKVVLRSGGSGVGVLGPMVPGGRPRSRAQRAPRLGPSLVIRNLRLYSNQVKWAPDNDDGYLNFHSISGDGRVSNWTLVKVNFDVWGYMQYASWYGVGYTMSFGSAIHISRPLSGTLTSWFLTLGSLCTILLKSSSPASSKVNFSRTVGGHIFIHWSKTDSGRAFAFKPDEPDLYLVGTGGKIYVEMLFDSSLSNSFLPKAFC